MPNPNPTPNRTPEPYYHDFRPMTSNRTRCDICGRTAGVKSHQRPTVVEELPRGIDRRPDGRLRYRFTPARGAARVEVYGHSIAEVYAKRYAPPVLVEVEPVATTVAAFLETWLETLALRANSIATHRHNVERHILPALRPGMTLAELTRDDVRAAFATIRTKSSRTGGTLAPRTVSLAYATLRRALYYAVEEGMLAANPAARINPNGTTGKGARARRVGVELRIPTELELRRVVNAAQGEDWLPLLRLAVLTGLRQSELLGLSSTSWDAAHLEVTRQLPRGANEPDDPKNASSARTVPLGPAALATLRELKLNRSVAQVAAGPRWRNRHDWLVTDELGAPLNGTTITHWLEAMCERAGVEPFRWHDLRHVYATGLLNGGKPIAVVSKYLGHADATITSRTYHHAHHVVDELGVAAAAERVLLG